MAVDFQRLARRMLMDFDACTPGNGRVERFIQTIKYECLFKLILFGQRHLDHILSEWVTYYNTRRSHTERDHLLPIHEAPEEVPKLDRDQIVVRSYVGGLVKSFERKAAA